MKLVKTEDAVGHVLCHDITQIIKGVTKDAVFRKGHIITEEDIPVLLSVGKEHLYVWENDETMMHENDAAQVLYDICKSEHTRPGDVKEGKIDIFATCDGLLKIDRDKLNMVNSYGQMMIASRHGDFAVKKGDKIAGTRIIPLVIEKDKMEDVRKRAGRGGIFRILPFCDKQVGIVTTGSEVYAGRIKDTFTDVIVDKIAAYGGKMIAHRITNDDPDMIILRLERPHFVPKQHHDSQYCSELNDDEEHILEAFAHIHVDKLIDQQHMAGAGYWQPLGYALDYAEDYNFQYFDKLHTNPSIIPIRLLQEHDSFFGAELDGIVVPDGCLHLADMRLAEKQKRKSRLADTAADGERKLAVQEHLVIRKLTAVIAMGDGKLLIEGLGVNSYAHGAELDCTVEPIAPEHDIAVQAPIVIIGSSAVVRLAGAQRTADADYESGLVLLEVGILTLL